MNFSAFCTGNRFLHASRLVLKTSQQANVMAKLIRGTTKKKSYKYLYQASDLDAVIPELKDQSRSGNAKVSNRRLAVLNAVYLERITDILSSSSIGHDLQVHSFFITKVKYATDSSALHIYWNANKDIEGVMEKLPGVAGRLRYELSALQSGKVPHLNFIHDRTARTFTDVEEILKRADFGTDYNPAKPKLTDGTEIPTFADSHPDDQSATQQLVKKTDILGVDREAIIHQVLKAMNRTAAPSQLHRTTFGLVELQAHQQRQVDFKKYLMAQKVAIAKKAKGSRLRDAPVDIEALRRGGEQDDEVDEQWDDDDGLDDSFEDVTDEYTQ